MCIFVSNFNMGSLATPERCSKLLRVNKKMSPVTNAPMTVNVPRPTSAALRMNQLFGDVKIGQR